MLPNAKPINLKHQRLWLLPQKALYWQKKKMLLIADLHVGKAGHFRRNGIPVPQQVNASNLELLDELIHAINPKHLIFLGDLFHSHINEEWQQFREWRKQHPQIEVTLVIGNHDILPSKEYHASHISVFQQLKIDPFLLIHDLETMPDTSKKKGLYPLAGHIHPAVKLKGKGRQTMKFPCFCFGENGGILPAFGHFTGTHVIKPKPHDRTLIIVNHDIVSLSLIKGVPS